MAARCMWKKRPTRRAAWCASASGTAMTGAIAASRSATDLIDWRASPRVLIEARPISRPGFFFGRSRSPGERSDPGDGGENTNGYSIWLAPPPDLAEPVIGAHWRDPLAHP